MPYSIIVVKLCLEKWLHILPAVISGAPRSQILYKSLMLCLLLELVVMVCKGAIQVFRIHIMCFWFQVMFGSTVCGFCTHCACPAQNLFRC